MCVCVCIVCVCLYCVCIFVYMNVCVHVYVFYSTSSLYHKKPNACCVAGKFGDLVNWVKTNLKTRQF